MNYQLAISPSGQLQYCAEDEDLEPLTDVAVSTKSISKHSINEILFNLAIYKNESGLSSNLRYWRKFACYYLTELCHAPTSAQPEPIPSLTTEELENFLHSVPPMKGGEYLSPQVLENIWLQLDAWVQAEINRHFKTTSEFLLKRAPQWHQVGRVCFHLAENKNDPAYPLAFLATYSPDISAHGQNRHQPLGKALQEYAGSKNKTKLIHLLSPIQLASQRSALIQELVTSGDIYHPLAWTPAEAYQFLKQVPLFEECGIVVRLPDWWKKRVRPRVGAKLSIRSADTGQASLFNLSSLLDFDVQFALGDEQLTEAEWQQLLDADDGLILLKGQWIEVDKAKLDEALAHWKNVQKQAANDGLSFIEGMRLLAGAPMNLTSDDLQQQSQQWSFVQADEQLSQMLHNLRHPESLRITLPNKQLHASLRPYQEVGVKWLWQLTQLGLGACLADDMGLGKTIQVIALLLMLKQIAATRPSLLILPASLLGNWQQEIKKFAPSVRCQFIHSSMASKEQLKDSQSISDELSHCDLVITSYGMLSRQSWLLEQQWQLVILDEAQAIKNPNALQTKTVKQLNAQARIALTGTPVENRVSDLWSLFDFICPGLLGSATRFKQFIKSLEQRETEHYAPLRNLVQPYILRRLKTDKSLIADLPDKTEIRAYCQLSKAQASLYEKSVRELTKAIENVDGIQRRGLVLSYLLRFKQICNHPSQLLGDGDYSPEHSGKYARLAELCEEISARQEKVLIFTQFREICAPLAEFLAQCFKRPGLILHGGVAVKQRQRLVEQFQQEDGPPFFVLSIKAGGTGLNLTAASHVIHFDRWWNPAVENQATDRAFRIGQRKNVLVHKFVCQGTIEEKVDQILEAKSALSTELLSGGAEMLLTEMSDTELINLVKLDIEMAQV